MFENNGLSCATFSGKTSRRLVTFLSILILALLVQVPAYATDTDMLEADPDPDVTSNEPPMMIVVNSLEDVDVESLPPGNYLIVATQENQTFEIQVQS